MEDSKQDEAEGGPLDETTCWKRLLKNKVVVLCMGLAKSRFAMFCNCLLAFLPVVDILSDLLTAANFANNGHLWWTAITLGVFYLSGRFTVLFMAKCPGASARNILLLYLPFLSLLTTEKKERTKGVEGYVEGRHGFRPTKSTRQKASLFMDSAWDGAHPNG